MATMFPCPNCGGQLRFSPKSHFRMKCTSCGKYTNAREYTPDSSMGKDSLNTKVYTCPTCAGEIQLIDNDGMEFCPFCGNQTTMQEHFAKGGAPKYILPFALEKEEAKEKYNEQTKKYCFTPNGLDDKENIDKMVGMYVPYFIYEYGINDIVKYSGSHEHTSGNYHITDYANVTVNVDVEDVQVPFDGSQTLDDTISHYIEPFPMDNLIEFNPNYLAGFFVENSSVDKDLYVEDANEGAKKYLFGKVLEQGGQYKPNEKEKTYINRQLNEKAKSKGVAGAYFPLYFLTTRYGDRVAYSIVNGANGNLYMDMPIDKNKMYRTAFVVSMIIFAILLGCTFLFDFSFKIEKVTSFSAFISSVISYVGAVLADKAYRKDNHLDDKGFFKTKDNVNKKKEDKEKKPKKKDTFWGKYSTTIIIVAMTLLIFSIFTGTFNGVINLTFGIMMPVSVIIIVLAAISVKKGDKKVLKLGIFGWLFSYIIHVISLPNDIFYYGAMIFVFVMLLHSMSAVVHQYNVFATRPSPQFEKHGGGLEHAK
ncbi:MAG: hypothetical protein K5883_09585 [Pseudobutyrivibrio sp.]|nr:hypothetical protein [Pseudobutyrivibrio sp.]